MVFDKLILLLGIQTDETMDNTKEIPESERAFDYKGYEKLKLSVQLNLEFTWPHLQHLFAYRRQLALDLLNAHTLGIEESKALKETLEMANTKIREILAL